MPNIFPRISPTLNINMTFEIQVNNHQEYSLIPIGQLKLSRN